MSDKIEAPFTPAQVAALNRYQRHGKFHEFTCPRLHDGVGHRILIAEEDGWRCSSGSCEYRQDWAHSFMVDPFYMGPATIDAEHLERQRSFSLKTFGPGDRLLGVLDHIRKELVEVEAEPGDVTEWADLIILSFDGALRQGHQPQAIIDAVMAKQTKNESREWPDWRTMPEDKAIEHVRH